MVATEYSFQRCSRKVRLACSTLFFSQVSTNRDVASTRNFFIFELYEWWYLFWRFDTVQKLSFPLRISSVNVSNSEFSCGFDHIYCRNPTWKTSFFAQCEWSRLGNWWRNSWWSSIILHTCIKAKRHSEFF